MEPVVTHATWIDCDYEWSDQASFCGQQYETWKQSIVDAFILPNIDEQSSYLEIGPGLGRWTSRILHIPALLWLVEPEPRVRAILAERCRSPKARYLATDGSGFPHVPDSSVDFIWSYDVFVHLSPETASGYMAEIRRVLKPASAPSFITEPQLTLRGCGRT